MLSNDFVKLIKQKHMVSAISIILCSVQYVSKDRYTTRISRVCFLRSKTAQIKMRCNNTFKQLRQRGADSNRITRYSYSNPHFYIFNKQRHYGLPKGVGKYRNLTKKLNRKHI